MIFCVLTSPSHDDKNDVESDASVFKDTNRKVVSKSRQKYLRASIQKLHSFREQKTTKTNDGFEATNSKEAESNPLSRVMLRRDCNWKRNNSSKCLQQQNEVIQFTKNVSKSAITQRSRINKTKNNQGLSNLTPMSSLQFLSVLLLTYISSCQGQYNVHRQDPFALLSGTLQTYQRAACDSQVLNLECPVGTKISIQLVQYGRSLPSAQVCPPTNEYPRVYSGSEPFQCSFPEALKFIEEKCHGQEVCSMVTAPEVFGAGAAAVGQNRDPCPRYRKYVEVAYKCKPTQFKSRVVCRGKSLHLSCNHPDERLAIYSAAFASAVGSHIYCPSLPGQTQASNPRPLTEASTAASDDDDYAAASNPEQDAVLKCESSFATEAVMQICHGKSTCDVIADGAALGAPACTPDHNIYLKSVYTCVNKHIFKDEFRDDIPKTTLTTTTTTTTESTTTTTSTTTTPTTTALPTTTTESDTYLGVLPPVNQSPKSKEGEEEGPIGRASLPGPSLVHRNDGPLDDPAYHNNDNKNNNGAAKVEVVTDAAEEERNNFVVGFFSDFFASYQHIQNHKAKFILFLTLSIALGLALFLAMVVWGMYRSSRLTRIAQRLKRPRSDAPSRGGSCNNSPIHAFGGGNGNMMTSSPGSPCPPGTIDIELEVGDHEVDSVFRDPGMNPLIVPRSDSPIMHPLMGNNCTGNNSGAFPILPNGGGCMYGTLGRRNLNNNHSNFGHPGNGVMTLGRPRSERYCDGEIETHFQQQQLQQHQQPKRVQFPEEDFAEHQRYGGSIWTPLAHGNMMVGPPQQPNSSVSGSLRDESPDETFSSSPATSPLLQINHYQLNGGYEPYLQQQQQHHNNSNNNNNMMMLPSAQSPTNSDRQAVRYSTICRQGRIAPTMTHQHGQGQGPSPVRSVVIVAPGDPPLSPNTTANLMAQRESRMLSRAHQNGGCTGGDMGSSDAPRSMTLSRISPNGGDHLFYG